MSVDDPSTFKATPLTSKSIPVMKEAEHQGGSRAGDGGDTAGKSGGLGSDTDLCV